MIPLNLPPLQQRNWKDELKLAYKKPADLLALVGLTEHPGFSNTVLHNPDFATLAPRSYVQRIHPGDPCDPLLRQILPLLAEGQEKQGFSKDPLQEKQAQLCPGLIKKYYGRALIIVTGACAIHCRYCFRRHFPYHEGSAQIPYNWQTILDAIRRDTTIQEIILSGGDPLMLDTCKLKRISDDLENIPHIKVLRIHSRLPVVLPERVTDTLCHWLSHSRLRTVLVIHSNHTNEFNQDVAAALSRLRKTETVLLNQTVLLQGINDNSHTLAMLSWTLFQHRITPYYIHDLDRVAGAQHYAISNTRKSTLMQDLRSQLPGYLMPEFVQEIPEQPYKTPTPYPA